MKSWIKSLGAKGSPLRAAIRLDGKTTFAGFVGYRQICNGNATAKKLDNLNVDGMPVRLKFDEYVRNILNEPSDNEDNFAILAGLEKAAFDKTRVALQNEISARHTAEQYAAELKDLLKECKDRFNLREEKSCNSTALRGYQVQW